MTEFKLRVIKNLTSFYFLNILLNNCKKEEFFDSNKYDSKPKKFSCPLKEDKKSFTYFFF